MTTAPDWSKEADERLGALLGNDEINTQGAFEELQKIEDIVSRGQPSADYLKKKQRSSVVPSVPEPSAQPSTRRAPLFRRTGIPPGMTAEEYNVGITARFHARQAELAKEAGAEGGKHEYEAEEPDVKALEGESEEHEREEESQVPGTDPEEEALVASPPPPSLASSSKRCEKGKQPLYLASGSSQQRSKSSGLMAAGVKKRFKDAAVLVDGKIPEGVSIDSPTKRLASAYSNREMELKAEIIEQEVSAALFEARCNLVLAKRRLESAENEQRMFSKHPRK